MHTCIKKEQRQLTRVVPEKKQRTLEKAQKVREKLRSRAGPLPPSAELAREDRNCGHRRVGRRGRRDLS
jgi:hypothetical protein